MWAEAAELADIQLTAVLGYLTLLLNSSADSTQTQWIYCRIVFSSSRSQHIVLPMQTAHTNTQRERAEKMNGCHCVHNDREAHSSPPPPEVNLLLFWTEHTHTQTGEEEDTADIMN